MCYNVFMQNKIDTNKKSSVHPLVPKGTGQVDTFYLTDWGG
jgi:hypothetical protein